MWCSPPCSASPRSPSRLARARRRAIGISEEDTRRVVERVAAGTCLLGLRFSGDRSRPPERFETLRALLGDGFVGIELDSSPGNRYGHRKSAHSVLTEDLDDRPGTPTREALNQVLDLFRSRLLA